MEVIESTSSTKRKRGRPKCTKTLAREAKLKAEWEQERNDITTAKVSDPVPNTPAPSNVSDGAPLAPLAPLLVQEVVDPTAAANLKLEAEQRSARVETMRGELRVIKAGHPELLSFNVDRVGDARIESEYAAVNAKIMAASNDMVSKQMIESVSALTGTLLSCRPELIKQTEEDDGLQQITAMFLSNSILGQLSPAWKALALFGADTVVAWRAAAGKRAIADENIGGNATSDNPNPNDPNPDAKVK